MRAPKPLLTTSSMVSASQTPAATSAIASRLSACCSRLPTKPGMSFFTCTGLRPASRSSAMVRRTVSALVFSFWITSTSGTRCGGFQKCVPTTRSRCLSFSPIRSREWPSCCWRGSCRARSALSSSAKSCCLSGSFSGAASNTKACVLHRRRHLVMRRNAAEQRGSPPSSVARALQPLGQRFAPFGRRIVDARPCGRPPPAGRRCRGPSGPRRSRRS